MNNRLLPRKGRNGPIGDHQSAPSVHFHHTQLANGLTVIGETNPAMRSVAVGFFVRTGARDETADISGVSHFLEHMVFKGTERRTALDVNKHFDAIGANYNAYTSEENTVFHAAVLPEYLPQAVDILADILRPKLRGEDFDMEKKVILEEIGMYEDQPMWSAYDAAKQAYFVPHALGNSVLGSKESVGGLKQEQMVAYHRRRYVAPNLTLIAAGNFNWDKLVALAEQHCGHWETGEAPREVSPAKGSGALRLIPREKVVQEHVFLLAGGPPASSQLRYSAEVLAQVVGDDTGSRLYWALVDPGHADSADMSFHEYDGTGVFYTYLSGEPRRTRANLDIALDVFRAVQAKGITKEELAQAKSKLGSRIVRGSERPMGRMQALGFYWGYLKEYHSVDDDMRAIDAVSLKSIREVLDAHPLDRLTIAALGPIDAVAWNSPAKGALKHARISGTAKRPARTARAKRRR
jgi:predicted Zn-dependent peptidase